MSNGSIIPFLFADQATVRTLNMDGETWFAARDVVEAVDSVWGGRAIAHVPDQWKGVHRMHTPGGAQEMAILSEQGVYFYLGRSDKPKALPMQMWIAGDVIPSIRKTGSYGTAPAINVRDQGQLAQITAQLIELNHELSLENQEMKPKALFHDAVAASSDDMDIYVSFSGGKDSTVMLDMVAEEARKRGRQFGCLFIDLEAQYELTIDHIEQCFEAYTDVIDPHWVALPLALRNAVSQYDPKWMCWEAEQRHRWVRQPSARSVTDAGFYPFFRSGMEFEEFAPAFGHWYSKGQLTACLVGIRADESLNRFRTLIMEKERFEGRQWTTWMSQGVWNAYPIYDWRTEDIWTYHAKTGSPHNRIYDRMHLAGLSIHQMRICQPYGDDQRKGLWLYHILEPHNWPRIVSRVNGANFGALYANETGAMLGRLRVDKPPGHSWQSYAQFLLESMPPNSREHYENKVAVFLKWWTDRGYPHGIPDEADAKQEAKRELPSWRRVVKVLVKGDYWCKGLSFGQTKSTAYEQYLKVMKNRRRKWGI